MLEANSQLQQAREDQYKQFFNEYDKDMARRMDKHMEAVTAANYQKQSNLNQIEEKNIQARNELLR